MSRECRIEDAGASYRVSVRGDQGLSFDAKRTAVSLMGRTKRQRSFHVFVLSVLFIGAFLCGCGISKNRLRNASPSEAALLLIKSQDYYAKRLRIGMPKKEALALLPKPQNTNTLNVCVWVLDSTETIKTQDRQDWQWLQLTRAGFFVVFLNEKLATPLCANAAFNPWQALEHYAGLTSQQAQDILGYVRP